MRSLTVVVALIALWIGGVAVPALAQTAEAVDRSALRVCADPNNLPYSNEAGEGFENKIAELLAKQLNVPVRYTWYPDSQGFLRSTLRAHKCDIVMGTTVGNEMLQNTTPYYHSAFSLVYRQDAKLKPTSLDDPGLKNVEIGVVAGTPPVTLMAMRGLLGHVHSYELVVDTRFYAPPRQLVNDVAAGKIDVGIVWGPIAGYYARQQAVPLTLVPLHPDGPAPVKLDYLITMGVRDGEPEWKRDINRLIRQQQPAINKILADYGVPLIDDVAGAPASP